MSAAEDRWTLRAARREDADAIGRLQAESQRSAFAEFLPEAVIASISEDESAAAWEQALAARDPRWVESVVESVGTLWGFASAGPIGFGIARTHATCELYALYVRPNRARRGVGRALLRRSLERLRALGNTSVQLTCMRDNPARAFFEGAGGMLVDEGAHEPAGGGPSVPHCVYVLKP